MLHRWLGAGPLPFGVMRAWLAAAVTLIVAAAARADDRASVEQLRLGAQALAAQDFPRAEAAWEGAAEAAGSNYLALEARARQAALFTPGTAAYARRVDQALFYFRITPPRWLSDDARALIGRGLDQRRGSGAFPDLAPGVGYRAFEFAAPDVGSGFHGKRYSWIEALESIPAPAGLGETNLGATDIAHDKDALPALRSRLTSGKWAAIDAWHGQDEVPVASRAAWQFDRCLVGYTLEKLTAGHDAMGYAVWQPTRPWYEHQDSLWRLRFRVFYPSPALAGGKDLRPVAENLCDALLRGHWTAWEYFSRQAEDLDGNLDVRDVWVTPNVCDFAEGAAAECWNDNLYFAHAGDDKGNGEWVREALHELSHSIFPHFGRYTASADWETWLDGNVGERLLLHALFDNLRAAREPLPAWLEPLKDGRWWADYRRRTWDPLAAYWVSSGPDRRDLLADRGDRGATYLLGFACWLADAHDPRLLHAVFQRYSLAGLGNTAQVTATAEDLAAKYRDALNASSSFTLSTAAAGRNSGDAPPTLGSDGMTLRDGCRVTWPLYLPTGTWRVRAQGVPGGKATLAVGQEDRRPLTVGDDQPPLTETGAGRWTQIELGGAGEPAAVVGKLAFQRLRR